MKERAKILIVDDEEVILHMLTDLLGQEGYTQVQSTRDPREVPALYREMKPDLIILDLHMPYWNGFVLLEELRSELEAEEYLPILMLTGDPNPDVKNQALVLGVKDFLHKPPDLLEARYRIRNLLQMRFLYLDLQQKLRERESASFPPADSDRARATGG